MVRIKKIKLKNFGGIANGEYSFDSNTSTLESKSGAGKTSAYYAYLWALGFGVDSWQPLIDGYRIYKLKTEVEVELEINSIVYTLGKTNTPKYKLDKFTGEEVYQGTDFKYFIDGQEQDSFGNYKNRIEELYGIDYFTLELLSNLTLFNNEDGKKWNKDERGKYLFKLFDLENKINLLAQDEQFESIKQYLEKGSNEIEINKVINAIKYNVDTELSSNQVLLEDKQKELGEYSSINFAVLEEKQRELLTKLEQLKQDKINSNKNNISNDLKIQINDLKSKLAEIESTNSFKQSEFQNQIKSLKYSISNIDNDVYYLQNQIKKLENDIEDCDIDIAETKELVFDENEKICPSCKQNLPEVKVQELVENFNKTKETKLQKIAENKLNLEKQKTTTCERLNNLTEQKNEKSSVLENLEKSQPVLLDTSQLKSQITELENKLQELSSKDDVSDIVDTQIQETQNEYNSVTAEIGKKDILSKIQTRIDEIKTRTRELGIQDQLRIAMKFALAKYTQEKMKLVNEQVNNHFIGVKYNFFKWLSANASKDYELVANAVLLENGTEYDNLSSGQKVKADLFTNNSLRKILNVNIPQFVDDIILSDLQQSNQEWQTIYLLTNNNKNLNLTLIKDCYSLKDCDIKK